jgi:hypothetical protein
MGITHIFFFFKKIETRKFVSSANELWLICLTMINEMEEKKFITTKFIHKEQRKHAKEIRERNISSVIL